MTAVASPGATPATGLTAAQASQRHREGLGNQLPPSTGRSIPQILRANIFTRINAILGVLFVLVLSTGSVINGAFGLLIVANSVVGIVQEIRAKRTLDRLTIVGQIKPQVRRDGVVVARAPEEVVVGDLIELGPGDEIVVDGQIRTSDSLDIDESMLTGEADAVDKHVGDRVLSGSFVASGTGSYEVTTVGKDAYAAKLAAEAKKCTLVKSELRSGIDSILRVITWLLIPAGLLTIINQLVLGGENWRASILGMVAALVPMVPEGLVLMTSIAFAAGVIRLGRKDCLVNELPAIEGLARVDVVCADKTGTLTENTLELTEIVPLGESVEVSDVLAALAAHDPRPNASVAAIAARFPDAPGWAVVEVAPFSSARKWSGMSFRPVETETDAGAGTRDAAGSAASAGSAGATHWLLGAADVISSPDSAPARHAEELGATGLRVLMLAETTVGVNSAPERLEPPGTVTPRALLVMRQKVRADAQATLDYFGSQHVQVKVISGDNARSVGAVAQQLGLGHAEAAIDARALPSAPTELQQAVAAGTVFGRVRPDQKRAMVGALQAQGHTVAMTGDGVNDVLALKDADVGVAMGSGSPATRSVAQIVLLDNRFATLPSVVGEGRRVIGNIERVSRLFLTKTVYGVALALAVGIVGVIARIMDVEPITYPFQPIHVTISAWFTIGIPAFILSLAPNNERARPNFVARVMRLSIPAGLVIAAATFGAYIVVHPAIDLLGLRTEADPEAALTQAATAALIAMITGALWVLCVVARPLNWWRVIMIALSMAAYLIIFVWGWTQRLFNLDSTNLGISAVGLGCGLLAAVVIEAFYRWIPVPAGDRVVLAPAPQAVADSTRT